MPLPRVVVGDHATEQFRAVIPAHVGAEFRSAVLERHGTLYDKMGHEATRALKAHTLALRAESRSMIIKVKDASDSQDSDPFLNCMHYNLKEGDESSEQEPRVL